MHAEYLPSKASPPVILASARAAFRITLPILIGFGFCGFSYGLYMRSLGFEPIFPILMALTIFAGSLEFIMASMITGPFAPLTAFIIGLIVNARHLFYGIAMLFQGAALELEGYTPDDPVSRLLNKLIHFCAPPFVLAWNWVAGLFGPLRRNSKGEPNP